MSTKYVTDLLSFIEKSPTPFHAVENLSHLFGENGFERLDEKDTWQLQPGKRYYYSRSDSSFIAFVTGTQSLAQTGIRLVGAHTDSPCLKVKPNPEIFKNNYFLLGIEVYGGVLLNTWFDRDLSLAGKVTGMNKSGQFCSALINYEKAIGSIPSLAIHLNRDVHTKKSVNAQKELNVLMGQADKKPCFKSMLLDQVKRQHPDTDMLEVLDFNLSFYDMQAPSMVGIEDNFIAAARLDNLLSTYIGAVAMIEALTSQPTPQQTMVLVTNDHEEIGSRSEQGAQGTMLTDLLDRLVDDRQEQQQTLRRSLMLSVDNAHGIHPNYPEKHDEGHGPELNKGPVIKFNANQSYATSSDTAAALRLLASSTGDRKELPLQSFVVRADMGCGSTIGPITASSLGIKTVDLGVPTFAMHSLRELAGVDDVNQLTELLSRFYRCIELP